MFTDRARAASGTSEDTPAAQALDLLSSLVDKSLVIREDSKGLACYRLHETMREFAGLKSRESGEHDEVAQRCAEYYRSRCQAAAQVAAWMAPRISLIRS